MAEQGGTTTTAPTEPILAEDPPVTQQQKAEMLADEDPLLISQSLTYVTDDGSVLHSFQSAPFSTGACRSNCGCLSQHWQCLQVPDLPVFAQLGVWGALELIRRLLVLVVLEDIPI